MSREESARCGAAGRRGAEVRTKKDSREDEAGGCWVRRMEIDVAQPEDWPELERIYRETREACFRWLSRERIAEARLGRDSEGEVLYVARVGGRVCGFVSVWAPDRFVHHLYVDLTARGNGAGSALLAFAARRHPGALRLKCVAQNDAAREFYLRRGWRVIDRGSAEDGDYLLMEKAGAPD